MPRYFVSIKYKGTAYHGWQRQPNAISVQQVMEDAFSLLLKQPIAITGAGRTDTGVHAAYFVLHFDIQQALSNLHQWVYKFNQILPGDIRVIHIVQVNPNAHARFDAISRTYKYIISREKDPFVKDLVYPFSFPLDIEAMNQAANRLFAYHDFTSFSKLHTDVKTNNCKILKSLWAEEKNQLVYTISADRFLRNMVRAIVGTLLDVGREKISITEFEQLIKKRNRSEAGFSVPSSGLYLTGIEYPEHVFSFSQD